MIHTQSHSRCPTTWLPAEQKRVMAFLKLRQKLTEEAQTEVEAARAAAAKRATERAAREAAAAAAAREAAAQAAVAAVPSPRADGGRTPTLQRDFSGVAASLGLAELFGSDAEEEEAAGSPSTSPSTSPAAPAAPAGPAGPAGPSGPPVDDSGGQPRPAARSDSGVAGAALPPPPSAAPALPATRPPLQLGAAAAAAATAAATPASAPSTARRSGQPASSRRPPRLRGFGRQDLKAFLEARGAGGWAGVHCLLCKLLSAGMEECTSLLRLGCIRPRRQLRCASTGGCQPQCPRPCFQPTQKHGVQRLEHKGKNGLAGWSGPPEME